MAVEKEGLDIYERIQVCCEKIFEGLSNNITVETKSNMESDEIDLETIHSEIIDNIPASDTDSGLSDLEEEFQAFRSKKKKLFEIIKTQPIIKKDFSDIVQDSQEKEEAFNPLNFNNNSNEKNGKPSEEAECLSNYDTHSESTYCNASQVEQKKISRKTVIHDPYSNFNKYNRDYIPKIVKCSERFKNKVPFLRGFNPKFLKKENIDKKIFRRFRNFAKQKYDELPNEFEKYDKIFWKNFSQKNLLPPMKYSNVEFKSFNTKYFLWLFSQKGTLAIFNSFLESEGDSVLNSFVVEYDLINSKEEGIISKLKTYLFTIPKIYSSLNSSQSELINVDYESLTDTYLGMTEISNVNSNPFKLNFSFAGFLPKKENKLEKLFKEEESDYQFECGMSPNYDEGKMNLSIDSEFSD